MLAPFETLDTTKKGKYVGPSHFIQDELEGVSVRHEPPVFRERLVNDRKMSHRASNLAVGQHGHLHITQVVHKQRQAVVALITELATGLLETSQDAFGPGERFSFEQVLPGRVRNTVARLAHTRTL